MINMKRINEKKLFGSAIVAALFLSMGMTVFAAT